MIITSKEYYPEGYQRLAKSVINKAISDYYLYINKSTPDAKKIVKSCIRFFQSDAFMVWAEIAQICIDQDKFITRLYLGLLKGGIQ